MINAQQHLATVTKQAAAVYTDLMSSRPDDVDALASARDAYKAAQARELSLDAGEVWEMPIENFTAVSAAHKAARAAGDHAKKPDYVPGAQRVCRVCCKSFSVYFRRLYCSDKCYQAQMLENKRRARREALIA